MERLEFCKPFCLDGGRLEFRLELGVLGGVGLKLSRLTPFSAPLKVCALSRLTGTPFVVVTLLFDNDDDEDDMDWSFASTIFFHLATISLENFATFVSSCVRSPLSCFPIPVT
jgi:hypothetical protein